ncbi:MAG: hypothetical protein L0387_14635 [Acidobacteria bacterium]|nr:hypothetical protein [Acidobacteriota bacterium]
MNTRTVTAILPAARAEVFGYLSQIENLPRWATEFCRELKVVNGKHKVVTCDPDAPELFIEIRSDRSAGVIDFLAGPAPDQLWTFPTRVVGLPDGQSIYIFTTVQMPGLPDEKFEQECQSLLREFENIRRRFERKEASGVL